MSYIRLMFDVLHLAFQTDSTRVATFMIAGDGNNREFSEIGVNDGHHNLSHHGNKEDWIEKVKIIDHFYVSQLAYFLEKMEATKDAARRPAGHQPVPQHGRPHRRRQQAG